MSYVDGYHDRENDIIKIVERDSEQKRIYQDFPARYVFYYPDQRGKFNSIYGEPLNRVICKNWKDFIREQKIHSNHRLYEHDINPINRILEENYLGKEAPKLNIAFFDIETDFQPYAFPSDHIVKIRKLHNKQFIESSVPVRELNLNLELHKFEVFDHIDQKWVSIPKSRYTDAGPGYASPEDAFMPITAISIHLQWLDTLVCLAVPPKTLSMSEAQKLIENFPNTVLFETEYEMLDNFLNLIDDVDVLTGWNSEGFDIPYIVNRVTKVLSKEDTRRFCLWNQFPKKREFEKYGKTANTYDLVGRVHLDSLEIYRKYTYEERHSYSLDAIGMYELNERKTKYEGSLDQLYNTDFKKFIEYNRQDSAMLNKLDKKLGFLDISNKLAHENTVLLRTTMGTVGVAEQAIINEAHHRNMMIPGRPHKDENANHQAAGAYVATPKKGLHDWVGSVDINSLYPSVIRALNMGPETMVGQLRQDYTRTEIESKIAKGMSFAAAWENKFGSNEYEFVMNKDKSHEIIIDWVDGRNDILTGAQIYELLFESNQPWMISANGTIFTYEKEGVISGLLTRWIKERKELQKKLIECIAAGNTIEEEYWDKRQLIKKILLNSLYGALLNAGCRFFDIRIGQSTTLTGRRITRHMAAKINEIITGEYNYIGKSIIYGDTDSAYFSAYNTLKNEINKGQVTWDRDTVIQLYNSIAEEVNHTFPQFMSNDFHCPKNRGDLIKAGRELVALKGLFITKKRYAVLYYDKDNKRQDIGDKSGNIKAMGLDLKRSDTPEFMQEFLQKILDKVLNGAQESEILEMITTFRTEFKARPGWEKGSPKRVNNVAEYQSKEEKAGKANLPGHVRASINWNTLKRMNGDKYSMTIVDGMKVVVCKVKDNPMGFTSVAYPVDELRLPKWFQDLPFNHAEMETTIINNKLDNLIGVLDFDLEGTTETNTFGNLFSFE
jgi:DNA polymerase elongation subunit (family B)